MAHEIYQFGPYRLNCLTRSLERNGQAVSLKPKEFDILRALVRCAPKPVSRSELISAAWPDQTEAAVTDETIRSQVSSLREVLGSDEAARKFLPPKCQQGYYLAVPVTVAVPLAEPASPRARRPILRSVRSLAIAAAVIVIAGALLFAFSRIDPLPPPAHLIGRILARSTSEGRTPLRIPLPFMPEHLAISPKGDKIFVSTNFGRTLAIINTANHLVYELTLPRPGGALSVSSRGVLYVGSNIEGVMAVDIADEKIDPHVLPTGGPVINMAIDPAGAKLFLAMGQLGAKSISLPHGKLAQITDQTCPVGLALDHQGNRLYIAYQCSGPAGHRGHDSVEVFDVKTNASLGIATGPPMVGGSPFISPNDNTILLDGGDACSNPSYNHAGCAFVPEHVFHLLRAADRQFVHTFEFDVQRAGASFIDDSRFLLFGNAVSVIHAAKYTALEEFSLEKGTATRAVFSPDGRRLWVAVYGANTYSGDIALLAFDTESDSCAGLTPGPVVSLTGDGTLQDSIDVNPLTAHGQVRFMPGKVGQAFFLDGASFLSMPWTNYFQIGGHNFAFTLYAKFAADSGEATLMDWTADEPRRGIRLTRSGDGHIRFDAWPGANVLQSRTPAKANTWYHVGVSVSDTAITLYVNGAPEDSLKRPYGYHLSIARPLYLGASAPGRPAFHGWLDEINFYNRDLAADEILNLYTMREDGPCKL